MKDKLNNVIDMYKNTEVYSELSKYYVSNTIAENEYTFLFKHLKRVLVSYYYSKFPFLSYYSDEPQSKAINSLRNYCNLSKKVRFENGEYKIYPVSNSETELNTYYVGMLAKAVARQIESGLDIMEIFEEFANKYADDTKKIKNDLIQGNMKPFYGCPSYMIDRARFIKKCIADIPNVDINIDNIISKMEEFERKYLLELEDKRGINEYFKEVDEEFYSDYDNLETYYQFILQIENDLCPVVMEHWKNYLTDPNNHDDSHYKYVMHTFSSGMVDPKMMNKACCALNTDQMIITPYGNCGLIYDVDPSSLETMCSEDVGSWSCTKRDFIERGCPSRWQLTNLEGNSVWYEYPQNSKIIMPQVLEDECQKGNVSKNGEILNYTKFEWYSEIYLNSNAKAVGVFYTDKCQNYDEVAAYAFKYNLPLVNISLTHQRELNGLAPLENKSQYKI